MSGLTPIVRISTWILTRLRRGFVKIDTPGNQACPARREPCYRDQDDILLPRPEKGWFSAGLSGDSAPCGSMAGLESNPGTRAVPVDWLRISGRCFGHWLREAGTPDHDAGAAAGRRGSAGWRRGARISAPLCFAADRCVWFIRLMDSIPVVRAATVLGLSGPRSAGDARNVE